MASIAMLNYQRVSSMGYSSAFLTITILGCFLLWWCHGPSWPIMFSTRKCPQWEVACVHLTNVRCTINPTVFLNSHVFFPTQILVGGLEHDYIFPYIWNNIIISFDVHVFQRGRSTTNQNKQTMLIWLSNIYIYNYIIAILLYIIYI